MAALVSGGSVTEISIFSLRPHVRIAGPATMVQAAFRAAAGTGLSFLAYAAFVFLTRHAGPTLQLVRFTASCFIGAELFGWILSSLLGSSGSSPDDARRFLDISGFNRYSVAAFCAAIGLVGVCLFFRGPRGPVNFGGERD